MKVINFSIQWMRLIERNDQIQAEMMVNRDLESQYHYLALSCVLTILTF